MLRSLVGSEMCIRDSVDGDYDPVEHAQSAPGDVKMAIMDGIERSGIDGTG